MTEQEFNNTSVDQLAAMVADGFREMNVRLDGFGLQLEGIEARLEGANNRLDALATETGDRLYKIGRLLEEDMAKRLHRLEDRVFHS